MFDIIEYNVKFTYKIKEALKWFDEFVCNNEWEIIRIKNIKHIQKSYKDKTPNKLLVEEYNIALYRKNRWHVLLNGEGNTIRGDTNKLKIPGIEITSQLNQPLFISFNFDYDFHTLLTIIHRNENAQVIENKKISLIECRIIYKKLEIYVNGSILSYRGKNTKEFKEICEEIKTIYKSEEKQIYSILKLLDKPEIDPKSTHKAIAYKTWYNAKRENQREWPLISTSPKENSIEFPKNSKIYYYYPNKYIGLVERKDINSEKYIPRIYNKNHLEKENSILYCYINNKKHPKKENKKEILDKYDKNYKAQALDKQNKRYMLLDQSNKWIKSSGNKMEKIPALPYNFRQIIHDYYKLNRLKEGEIMDLTHIGIVEENGKDEITFPKISDKIIISKCLETKRTMSFKLVGNENILKVLYD